MPAPQSWEEAIDMNGVIDRAAGAGVGQMTPMEKFFVALKETRRTYNAYAKARNTWYLDRTEENHRRLEAASREADAAWTAFFDYQRKLRELAS